MTEAPKSYMGMPLITATPQQIRTAVMLGRFLHREAGMAMYEYGGKIFVVEAGRPPATNDQRNR